MMPYLHTITSRPTLNGKAALVAVSLLLSVAANSQIIEPLSERVRMSPEINPALWDPGVFIGNYPVIDLDNPALADGFNIISGRKAGTLFLVIRPREDSLSDKRLLKLGPISLYKDSVLVDGGRVNINSIKDEPVIIKIQYQGFPRKRWFSRQYNISKEIDLAELVWYETMLSDSLARIAESFLALKYSINITSNSDPQLRDYLGIYDEKVWNTKTDNLYDEEVMALGRMNRAGFYQSQTMTADSRHIKISLDSAGITGVMPSAVIQDSSLLVLSKGSPLLNTPQCGGSPVKHLWKLKLFNWNSTARILRIEMDSLPPVNNLVITDGLVIYPVPFTQQAQHTIMEVPLTRLTGEAAYFILASSPADSCDLVYNLTVSPCDSNGMNSVNINLTSLPAQFRLVNLSNGFFLEKTISASMARVSGLEPGQYELMLSNGNGLILDSVFVLEPCPGISGTVPEPDVRAGGAAGDLAAAPWIFEEAEGTGTAGNDFQDPRIDLGATKSLTVSSAAPDKSISIFPNPAPSNRQVSFTFTGLKGESFTIQITDSKGALLKEEHFTPVSETATWYYSFPQTGIYLARAFSDRFKAVQQIIISGN